MIYFCVVLCGCQRRKSSKGHILERIFHRKALFVINKNALSFILLWKMSCKSANWRQTAKKSSISIRWREFRTKYWKNFSIQLYFFILESNRNFCLSVFFGRKVFTLFSLSLLCIKATKTKTIWTAIKRLDKLPMENRQIIDFKRSKMQRKNFSHTFSGELCFDLLLSQSLDHQFTRERSENDKK